MPTRKAAKRAKRRETGSSKPLTSSPASSMDAQVRSWLTTDGFDLFEIQWQGSPPTVTWAFNVSYAPAGKSGPQPLLLFALLADERHGRLDFLLDLRVPDESKIVSPTPYGKFPEPWGTMWKIALTHGVGMATLELPNNGGQLLRFDDTVWFDAPLTKHLLFSTLRRLYRVWIECSVSFRPEEPPSAKRG